MRRCRRPGRGDGQDSCNLTRKAAAEALVDWLATEPTRCGDDDFLILGDLNSYDQEEPDILDYDTSLKQDAQDALYEPNPYRSSDHDPVIVGLDLSAPPVCSGAEPSQVTLWPPSHMMESIQIDGVADPEGDAFTIEITSVYQDDPVDLAGDSDGSTSPDGVGIGTNTAQVRAERIEGGNGRVYHIGFTATDEFGAACSGALEVSVPSSQGRNGAAVDDGALYDSTEAP